MRVTAVESRSSGATPLMVGQIRSDQRADPTLIFRLSAAAALLAAFLVPVNIVSSGPVMCPFRLVTGLPCPGCGLTRSCVDLLHGNLVDSIRWHPLGPITVVAAVLLVLGAHRRFPGLMERLKSPAVLGAIAAVWIVVWLIRLPTFQP